MAKGKKSKGTKYVSQGKVPTISKKNKRIINKDKVQTLEGLRQSEKAINNVINLKNPNSEQKRLKAKYIADKECNKAITPYLNKYRYLGITKAEAKHAYLKDSMSKLDNKYRDLANKQKKEEKAIKNVMRGSIRSNAS